MGIENSEIKGHSLSRWNGSSKYLTKECASCNGYEETETNKVCKLGIAWKILTDEKILNTCSLKKSVKEQQIIEEKPLHPVIVYTPTLKDFVDRAILFRITELGWKTELVREDTAHEKGSMVMEFRK